MSRFIASWVVGLSIAVALGSLVFIIGNAFAGGAWVYWEFMRTWLIGYLVLEGLAILAKIAVKLG